MVKAWVLQVKIKPNSLAARGLLPTLAHPRPRVLRTPAGQIRRPLFIPSDVPAGRTRSADGTGHLLRVRCQSGRDGRVGLAYIGQMIATGSWFCQLTWPMGTVRDNAERGLIARSEPGVARYAEGRVIWDSRPS
jgi:hypothetical protein